MDACPLVPQFERVMEATEDTRLVQSVVLNGHGRFNRISVIEAPLPRYIKDDHVEVEVYYCGLNFTDNYLRLGIIRSNAFPIIMGSECCGVVTRVGAGVTLQVGQRVVCLRMQGGLFRRVVQVPRANVFPLPPTIGLKDAMALALDAVVAHVCLIGVGQIEKASVVFMQSLAGGVGTMVAQLARLVKETTMLGTASEDKHDGLRRLGVDGVYRHQDNYVERVLKEHPEGADIVIVRGGGAETEKCLKLLKSRGRLITIGSDSTATYPRTLTMALQRPKWDTRYLSSAEIINKNVTVAGLNIGQLIENFPYDVEYILDLVFDLYLQEQIAPQIDSILPFEKMAEGLELLCRRQNFGKVLLELRDEAEFESSVPSPPKHVSVRPVRVEQRLDMRVFLRRGTKQSARQDEDLEVDYTQSDEDYLDDSMFTEVEAIIADNMTKAFNRSVDEARASQNL